MRNASLLFDNDGKCKQSCSPKQTDCIHTQIFSYIYLGYRCCSTLCQTTSKRPIYIVLRTFIIFLKVNKRKSRYIDGRGQRRRGSYNYIFYEELRIEYLISVFYLCFVVDWIYLFNYFFAVLSKDGYQPWWRNAEFRGWYNCGTYKVPWLAWWIVRISPGILPGAAAPLLNLCMSPLIRSRCFHSAACQWC